MDAAHDAPRPFPRGALAAAFLLVGGSLAGVALARLLPAAPDPSPTDVVAERALRFADRPGGTVEVLDAASGTSVAIIGWGEGGFVRQTLRGLVRDRTKRAIGQDAAFVLATHADGRLSLVDPATGRVVELAAFGHTNEDAFRRFLSDPIATRVSNNQTGTPQEAK